MNLENEKDGLEGEKARYIGSREGVSRQRYSGDKRAVCPLDTDRESVLAVPLLLFTR